MANSGLANARRASQGLKARLAGALLLASTPGLVLAGVEAQRRYVQATERTQTDLGGRANAVASHIDEVFEGTALLLHAIAASTDVRAASPDCGAVLSQAMSDRSRFGNIARSSPEGRILCNALGTNSGADLSVFRWFEKAKKGVPWAVSERIYGQSVGENVVPIGIPIERRGKFAGVLHASIRTSWLTRQVREDLRDDPMSLVLLDERNEPIVLEARGVPPEKALEVARAARTGKNAAPSSLTAAVAQAGGGAFAVVLMAPSTTPGLGFSALLTVAAPILAAGLAAVAVWVALNAWVVRWIERMVESAHNASAGRPQPANLAGAPTELQLLGEAFDEAVESSSRRADELRNALGNIRALARELHHRVKNNLQVMTSSLARQQRRVKNPAARLVLAEARARLLPIALTYRFSAAPEDVTRIELGEYLSALAAHVTSTLGEQTNFSPIHVECASVVVSSDVAMACGMIACEVLTAGLGAQAPADQQTQLARVTLKLQGEEAFLECAAADSDTGDHSAHLDRALIDQLARQLGATIDYRPGPCISMRWRLRPPAQTA